MNKELEAWLKTRPECVQKLAAEFPAGSILDHEGEISYVIGWTEDDKLIVSTVDPYKDFDGAFAAKGYAHAQCVRDAIVGTEIRDV